MCSKHDLHRGLGFGIILVSLEQVNVQQRLEVYLATIGNVLLASLFNKFLLNCMSLSIITVELIIIVQMLC